MGRLVVLSENVFSRITFPGHTLSASSENPDHDVGRIAAGRRQRSLNYWTPTSDNAAAWVAVACDRVRLVDTIFIDRGHNVDGKTVRIQASFDSFASWTETSAVVPSSTFPNSRLAQTNGVRTEEGAWGYRFSGGLAGSSFRVYFDAMGANLRPEIVGLYLGQGFRPTLPVIKPFSFGKRQLNYEVIEAPSAWAGAGEVSQRKRLPLTIRLEPGEYPVGRYHMEELFMRARPSWIVPDDEQAERAFLNRAEPQEAGFEIVQGRSDWEGTFVATEHEPRTA